MSEASYQTQHVLTEVALERSAQRGRWGNVHDDHHGQAHWAMILGTYFGRLSQAVFHYTQPTPTNEAELRHVEVDRRQIRATLVKVAAIAVAWIEAIDRKEAGRAVATGR